MIVKHLVEQYSGTIWVESNLGDGSNFKFKLKLFAKEKEGGGSQLEQIDQINNRYKFNWKAPDDRPVIYVNNLS